MYGSQTPMHGSRTPMYGSQTPTHGEGKTPAEWWMVMLTACWPLQGKITEIRKGRDKCNNVQSFPLLFLETGIFARR